MATIIRISTSKVHFHEKGQGKSYQSQNLKIPENTEQN